MANEPTPTKQPAAPAHRWRWITNNGPMRIFPRRPVWSEQAKSSTPDGDPLAIRPGAQLVETKRWETLKEQDPADKKIDGDVPSGAGEILRLLKTKIPKSSHKARQPENEGAFYLVEGPHVANKNAPLDGLSEVEAVEVIDKILDESILRACIQIEKRPAVNEALHRVLDGLTKGMQSTVAA